MVTCNGESEENKLVIAVVATEDHTLRNKKMEGGDEGLNLNTVECLRGRLLAERQASRVAKEEEELTGKKLVEVERMLREEIRLREKAERKLKFLRKKLESFNISPMSKQSEHSDSSETCENSCGSASVSSISKHFEPYHAKNQASPGNVVVHNHDVMEASAAALIQTHNNSPSTTTKDCDSQITDNSSCNSDPVYSLPEILMENPNPSSEDFKNDESRLSSLSSKSSVTENEDDKGNFFDNSMALVPVNLTATSHAPNNPKPVNESVLEVLDALKHARERLQGSIGTRQMIQVGPT